MVEAGITLRLSGSSRQRRAGTLTRNAQDDKLAMVSLAQLVKKKMMAKTIKNSWWQKVSSWIERNEWLVLILALVVILRIPTLFEPHRYADEEIYLTLGRGLRKGLALYRDIHDNKPPLLYLTAMVAGNVFWFRFILMIANILNVVVFWKLAELIFSKSQKGLVRATTVIFGIFSTIPMFEGNIANAENFFILATTLGVYLLYRAIKAKEMRPWWEFLAVGVLFVIGFLYKVPVAFDFLGVMLFWWCLARPKEKIADTLKFLVNPKVWLVIVGFVVPILLSIGYFAKLGVIEPYVRAALLQNVGYVSSWRGGSGLILNNPLVWRGLVVIGVWWGLWIWRKKLSQGLMLVGMWLVFGYYGVLLSSRPYPHYLLEVVPAMSLLLGLVWREKDKLKKIVAGGLIVLAVGFYWDNSFWYYKTIPYYQNFIKFIIGQKSKEEYFNFWEGVGRNYKVGKYIKMRTLPDERIFVWGTEPSIYAISDRLPVGKYTVEYHVVDFDAFEETIEAIEKVPAEIVVMIPGAREFVALEAALMSNSYLFETEIEGVRLYRHVNGLKHNGVVDQL